MWVWQLVLTPTHWESKEVYCFSRCLGFGDTLFVAVIFKAIQLLYFERRVWEKAFFFFVTSLHLNLPEMATILYQLFFGPCLWMKSQKTCPINSRYWNHLNARALQSLHTRVFVIENHNGNTFWALKDTVL